MTRKRDSRKDGVGGLAVGEKLILANSKYNIVNYSSVQEALKPFGVPLTPALADSLRQYLALLLRWNQKINLTASSDLDEILQRHIGESLFGARFLPEVPGTIYDVGSGAGFPGLPIKLARPEWELVLVESDHRKAAFLSEAVRVLNLGRARVLVERFDRLPTAPPLADVIMARALGQYPVLLDWSKRALRPSGRVLLWLGSRDAAILSQVRGWLWEAPVPL